MRDQATGDARQILRVDFSVERTLKKQPNKVDITVYNLSLENRTALQKTLVQVSLEAGYIENRHEIFSGQVTFAKSILTGNDWVTTFQAGDGVKAFQSARVNTSLKGPVKPGDALQACVKALGFGEGNIAEKLGGLRDTFKQYTQGVALSGKAEKKLSGIVHSMGYDWSVQGGQVIMLGPKEYIGTDAYLLSKNSGLVSTPEPGEKGIIKLTALLIPDLAPGRPVEIDSPTAKGLFRIEKVIDHGSTHTLDWFADLEAKPI